MLIDKLFLKHQQLTASFQHSKAGHQELCNSNENYGYDVLTLVAEMRNELNDTRLSMETEVNTLNQKFNDLCGLVEALEQSVKLQRVDHSSLTADDSVLNTSMLKEFDTLGRNTDELCRRMKSLEVELETKKSKDSVFMADCLVKDEAHGRNLNRLRGKVQALEQSLKSQRVDHNSLTADDSALNTSMLKEFDKKAKISKCNSKVEAYHGEFVFSQIDSWHSPAFLDTQFSNQCYNLKGGPDKKLIKRARAPVP